MTVAAPGQLNFDEVPEGCRGFDCFEKLRLLGQGTYGEVSLAKDKGTGELVALKKLKLRKEENREGFPITAIREIKILSKLRHENVIKLKEIVTSPPRNQTDDAGDIFMVFEYMDHDLTGLAQKSGAKFSVPQIKCYMSQLLKGLHYCHANGVLHRDIKSSNLLINNEGNLKLGDFGLARTLSSKDHHNAKLTNQVVTTWYRPPELLLGATKYGPPVDMWSAGCIFAELLCRGQPLFHGATEPEVLTKIVEVCGAPNEVNWPGVSKLPCHQNFKFEQMARRQRPLSDIFRHCDRHALELLERLLTLDPSKRISTKDALDADYFWTDPLPCDPKSLPKYESSHELEIMEKKRRQHQQRQHHEENAAKRQKPVQYQQRIPPSHQQSGQAQAQVQPHRPIHGPQAPVAATPRQRYEIKSRRPYESKPRRSSEGASRYYQNRGSASGWGSNMRGGNRNRPY
ncbi:hypothetical protein M0R45_014447 [Rubus argutus]|uniref:Protein kinase domain-containing protein n=1 Tax=Rubus argutus TaxID=59490 RepID=A0AAW1XM99_RUBAR